MATIKKLDTERFPWIKTVNPIKAFYPLDPKPEEIDITNIGWALSMQCRYNGHVREFYSVAQHSVIVSRIVESMSPNDTEMIMQGLLHDAHEAYIGDIITPVKKAISGFEELEEIIDKAVGLKFNLDMKLREDVKTADKIALVTEARDLQETSCRLIANKYNIEPMDTIIKAVSQKDAYEMFIDRFEEIQYRRDYENWAGNNTQKENFA